MVKAPTPTVKSLQRPAPRVQQPRTIIASKMAPVVKKVSPEKLEPVKI